MRQFLSSLLAAAAVATTPAPEPIHGVDFFLVQDVSYSYENDLPYLHDQIPKIMTYLATEYDDSAFGMSTFVDKPLGNFGYEISGDYCYDLTVPLTKITLQEFVDPETGDDMVEGILENGQDINTILEGLETFSGRDWPENQLGAILHALLSPNSKWPQNASDRATILALATDSGFHVRGDAPDLGQTEFIYSQDPDNWCLTEDYPSIAEIRVALEESNTRLLLLVTPDLVGYYEDFLKELGPDLGLVVGLRQRSAYIAEAVQTGLAFMRDQGYGFGSTATLKFKELLAAEADALSSETRLNREDPAAPQPLIEKLGITQDQLESFGPVKKLHKANVPTAKDKTDINAKPTETTALAHEAQSAKTSRSGGRKPRSSGPSSDMVNMFVSPRSGDHGSTGLYCGDDEVIFEVILVQDASESFENDRDVIAQDVPNTFRDIQSDFPGSRFGLAAFIDKPIEPFGYESANDYCASMRVGLTDDIDEVETSLENLIIRSGNDWKEAQLHGLMHSAYTHMADWSDTLIDEYGRKIIRVLALTTDAGYHEAGDSQLPANNGDRYQDCEGEDYPSVEQVGDALRGQMIYPLFLVTENVKIDYEHLLNRMGTNGAVRVMGDQRNRTQSLEDSIIGGLQSICNFKSVTPTNIMYKPPAFELVEEEGAIELDIKQRPKFLSIVTKK